MARGRPRTFNPVCSVPECELESNQQGMCKQHWYRQERYGTPYGGRKFETRPREKKPAVVEEPMPRYLPTTFDLLYQLRNSFDKGLLEAIAKEDEVQEAKARIMLNLVDRILA